LAVLLPPLVRARLNGSPANSVTNFRKQLNSLENAGGRYPQAQLRGMARPLAPSPRMQRQPGPLSSMTGALVRPEGARHHRPAMALNPQALVRQRRQNTVLGLAGTVIISLFLAATTGGSAFVYLFTASFLALIGYCYVLVQMRIKRDNERYLGQFRR
jgi:hypothetical protein